MPDTSTQNPDENNRTMPMIDFAIITALRVEREAVCKAFGFSDRHREKEGARIYWRGRVPLKPSEEGNFYEIVITQLTDMSNSPAVAAVMDTIRVWQPGALLLTGIAGAASVDQKLGDLVIGREIVYYEGGKVTPEGIKVAPSGHRTNAELYNHAMSISRWKPKIRVPKPDGSTTLPELQFGVIASSEKVIADAAARDEIHASNRKIMAIEMEGYGVAQAVWEQQHPPPLLVIRAICDMADSSKNKEWQPYAAAVAATFTRDFLLGRPLEPRNQPSASSVEEERQSSKPTRVPRVKGFVGRQKELAYFKAKFDSDHFAFIGGLPGIGKTSLALQLASQWSEQDPVFWFSFDNGHDVAALKLKLAQFLARKGQREPLERLQNSGTEGADREPLIPFFEDLIETIRHQGYLLCIDNLDFAKTDSNQLFKMFVDEVGRGGISILVTSRQRPDPITFQIPHIEPLRGLGVQDTQTFFVVNHIDLTASQAEEIRIRTGGNPALLLLAVGALRGNAADQVLKKIRRFPDVRRFLIQEISDSLLPPEPGVMRAVSALLGLPGTQKEIEAGLGAQGIEPTLWKLEDRYLLKIVDEDEAEEDYLYGEEPFLQEFFYSEIVEATRVEMHRRIGQYYEFTAGDLLKAAIHYERAGEIRHAAELATFQVPLNLSRGRSVQLRSVLESLKNWEFFSALDVQIRLALGQLYSFIGAGQLAEQAFENALQKSQLFGDTDEDRLLKADIYLGKGEFYEQNKDPRQSLECFTRGLEVLGELDPKRKGAFNIKQSSAFIALQEFDQAIQPLDKGQPLVSKNSHWYAKAEANRGIIASERGEFQAAAEHHRRTIEIGEQLDDNVLIAKGLNNLSFELANLGDRPGEIETLERLLSISDLLHSPKYQWAARNGLGVFNTEKGEYNKAFELLTEANNIAEERDLEQQEPYSLTSLAELHIRMGELDLAVPLLERATKLALQVEDEGVLPVIYYTHALALRAKNIIEAQSLCQQSIEIAHAQGQTPEEGKAWRVLGQILAENYEFINAYNAFETSLELLTSPYERARTKTEFARAIKLNPASDAASKARAQGLLAEAQNEFQKLGADKDFEMARDLADR